MVDELQGPKQVIKRVTIQWPVVHFDETQGLLNGKEASPGEQEEMPCQGAPMDSELALPAAQMQKHQEKPGYVETMFNVYHPQSAFQISTK